MTDKAPTPLQTLEALRDKFASAVDAGQQALAAVNEQIAAVKREEAKAEQEAALLTIVPGDKNTLKGHAIQFLLNNTKEGGKGPNSVLGASVAAAYKVNALVKTSGVDGASVVASFWGNSSTYMRPVNLDGAFGAAGYNTSGSSDREFLPAAKAILAASTPDNVKGGEKNYIIICDGTVKDDVAQSVAVLEAAARLNPKATFDFVVCNAADTNVDALVQKWSETAAGQKPNLVKVGTPAEIVAAVKNVVKARLAGNAYTAPAAKAAAPKAPTL